ncbi:hypothetical protein BBJ28_00011699, partial [Nothophytophthora sp. Chile5]
IETILDSDKILVLDAGEVVEFDSPSALLQMKDGVFQSLVASGKAHQLARLHVLLGDEERLDDLFQAFQEADVDAQGSLKTASLIGVTCFKGGEGFNGPLSRIRQLGYVCNLDSDVSLSEMDSDPEQDEAQSPPKTSQLGADFLAAEKRLHDFLRTPALTTGVNRDNEDPTTSDTPRSAFTGAERFLEVAEAMDLQNTGFLHEKGGERRELKRLILQVLHQVKVPVVEWLQFLRKRFERYDVKEHGVEQGCRQNFEDLMEVLHAFQEGRETAAVDAMASKDQVVQPVANGRIRGREQQTQPKKQSGREKQSAAPPATLPAAISPRFLACLRLLPDVFDLLPPAFIRELNREATGGRNRLSMVNQQKSKCQLRLEARVRTSCSQAAPDDGNPQQLAARLQSRLVRAAEIRAARTGQRTARARARVLHAQHVARATRARRCEDLRRCRLSAVAKVDEATRRRHEQLEQLQQQCKLRADLVTEKVELVRADQHVRADAARRSLADHLDEAARRREQQTQQLVRRLSARWQSVESVKERLARVKFIQRWFRRVVAGRTAAAALRSARMDVRAVVQCWTQMRTASFEASMGLLQQRPLVQAAQRLLKVLLLTSDRAASFKSHSPSAGKNPSSPDKGHSSVRTARSAPSSASKPAVQKPRTPARSPTGRSTVSFRVLLMAGMIACHPNDIMGSDRSRRLSFAADVVLLEMQRLAHCLEAPDELQPVRELTSCVSRLEARFAFYMAAFTRWKARDADRLAAELLVSYRQLLRVQLKYEAQAEAARHGGDGVYELLPQTQGQLQQMRLAVERLLGKDLARERLQQVEHEVLHAGDGRAAGGEAVGGNGGDDSASSKSDDVDASSPSDSENGAASPPPGNDGDAHDDKDKDEDDAEMQGDEEDEDASAPPAGVNASLLADRQLVHELILNPQFQLPSAKEAEAAAAAGASSRSTAALAVRVREAMTKAFWDRVAEANDVETLLARTEELRSGFRDALGGGSSASLGPGLSALADVVDSALQAEQLRELMQDPMSNVRALEARCNGVLDAVERAEAPARAEATRAFRSDWTQRVAAAAMTPVQLMVAFLAFALEKVDELRVDVLNAHLGLLGAYLQRHGVEYEQKQLQARLVEAGNDHTSFAGTEKWLRTEMQTYLTRPEVDDEERAHLARHDGAAFERFVRVSIWALVEKHIDGAASRSWPETFELDVARVRACRDALDRIAVVSSMLAVVHEYVARRGLPTSPSFLHDVGQQLSTLLRSPGISGSHLAAQAVQDVRQLEPSGRDDTEQELQALDQRLHGAFASDNPVFALFFSRASRAFEAELLRSAGGSTAKELHPSLAPFAKEIGDVAAEMRRLAQHNESVYASLYNNIIKRFVATM